MSDDFDARVREWMAARGRTTDEDVRGLVASVAAFPPRRPNRRLLALVATVVLGLGLAAVTAPRVGEIGARPEPPDPAAFAGDPRMATCRVDLSPALYAFELERARDYTLHLPAAGRAPELEVDEPAFVVVYAGEQPFGSGGGFRPTGSPAPDRTNQPGHHDLCVLVGRMATTPSHIYTDVDVSGLTAAIDAPPSIAATPTASMSPVPATAPLAGPPTPPDPAAFAGDPRLDACVANGGGALFAFEVGRGRDVPRYLPGLYGPEFEASHDRVLVVVHRDPLFVRRGPNPRSQAPGVRDVCVVFGPAVGGSITPGYLDVSLEGFDAGLAATAVGPPYQADGDRFPHYPGVAILDPGGDIADPNVIALWQPSCRPNVPFLQVGWPIGAPSTEFDNTRRFVGDVQGVLDRSHGVVSAFDADADLPPDATATGYRTDDFELWLSPTTGDAAAYLRFEDHVERWPAANLWSC
jgi:hypothetical protein